MALLWHAIVDALTVYLAPIAGTVGVEGVIAVCAVISLAILFRMRPLFVQTQTDTASPEALLSSSTY
jgi:hypothetical protein